jgi:hypothetical protein
LTLLADQWIADIFEAVLARIPVEVRQRYDHRQFAVQGRVDPSDDQDGSANSDGE